MEKSQNPSSILSRKLIKEALLALMERNKDYHCITITEIAYEAQIVRKTFYHHYSCVDDVLNDYVDELFDQYKDYLMCNELHDIYEHVTIYFRFWNEHIEFLNILQNNNMLSYTLTKYDEIIKDLFAYLPCPVNKDSLTGEYLMSYSAGGFWKLLCKWIERGGKETPEQMTSIFKNFFSQMPSTIS